MDFNAFGSSPKGYEQIEDLSAAIELTPPAQSSFALLMAEAKNVRWRDDGEAPTASVGMLLEAGVEFTYQGNLTDIQFIETEASAKLNVSYYAATGGLLKP